jgi:hypothetical protein
MKADDFLGKQSNTTRSSLPKFGHGEYRRRVNTLEMRSILTVL